MGLRRRSIVSAWSFIVEWGIFYLLAQAQASGGFKDMDSW